MTPPDDSKTFAVFCDTDGKILRFLQDDFDLLGNLERTHGNLLQIFFEDDHSIFRNFLQTITKQSSYKNASFTIKLKDELVRLLFSGWLVDERIFLTATLSPNQAQMRIYEEIMAILNDQANQLRQIHKEKVEIEQGSFYEKFMELNNELVNLQRELTRKNIALEQFNSMISHELKNPLASLKLSFENYFQYHDSLSPERREKLVHMIRTNLNIMDELVNDLLIISRMEAGRIKITPEFFPLREFMKQSEAQLKSILNSKHISLLINIDDDQKVFADKRRLGQIIRVLIDNAVKFSSEYSRVYISGIRPYLGKLNPEKKPGILIQVRDEGIGIPPEDLPRLFKRFFRGGNAQAIEGTGLGLSIAWKLVLKHGGDIMVESELGKGTQFCIFFPDP